MDRKTRHRLFRESASLALRTRLKLNVPLGSAINPYWACESLGIEVRFVDVPSLEGIYHRGERPLVLLSSCRPSGRKSATCGHELGHHLLGHGTSVDEIDFESMLSAWNDSKEYSADIFSAFFLMPRELIRGLLASLGVDCRTPKEEDIYTAAMLLDVSYAGFVTHTIRNLGLVGPESEQRLRRVRLPDIRGRIAGASVRDGRLIDLLNCGAAREIRVETGDRVLAPRGASGTFVNSGTKEDVERGALWRLARPGTFRLDRPSGEPLVIKVRRTGFTGRAIFQFLEDPDYEPAEQ